MADFSNDITSAGERFEQLSKRSAEIEAAWRETALSIEKMEKSISQSKSKSYVDTIASRNKELNNIVKNYVKLSLESAKYAGKENDIYKKKLGVLSEISSLNSVILDIETKRVLKQKEYSEWVTKYKSHAIEKKKIPILKEQLNYLSNLELKYKDQNNLLKRIAANYAELAEANASLNKNVEFFNYLKEGVRYIPGISILGKHFDKAATAAREAHLQNMKLISDYEAIKDDAKEFLNTNYKGGAGLNTAALKQLGILDAVGNKRGAAAMSSAAKALQGNMPSPKQISALGAGFAALGSSIAKAFGPIGIAYVIIKGIIDLFVQAQKDTIDIARNLGVTRSEAESIRQEFGKIQRDTSNIMVNISSLVEAQAALVGHLGASVKFSAENLENTVFLKDNLKLSADQAASIGLIFDATNKNSMTITNNVIELTNTFRKTYGYTTSISTLMKDVADSSSEIKGYFSFNVEKLAEAAFQTRRLGLNLEQALSVSKGLLNFESSIASELEAELLTNKTLNFEKARLFALTGKIGDATEEVMKQFESLTEEQKKSPLIMESVAKATGLSVDQLQNAFLKQKVLTRETREYIALLESQGRFEDAARAEKLGFQKLSRSEIEATLTTQEAFNKALEKAKSAFTTLVDSGALNTLTEGIIGLANGIKYLSTIIDFFNNPESRPGRLKKESKKATPSNINVEDFTIKSNPKDTIIAAGGTKLGRTDEMVEELKDMKKYLQGLYTVAKEGGNVYMDGNKVGKALVLTSDIKFS